MRVTDGEKIAVGPGKIALLEAIGSAGSITAAAKSLDMSYRRAWLLLDELNRSLEHPAVDSAKGGLQGGGTSLTETGHQLITLYRRIEKRAEASCREDIAVDEHAGALITAPREPRQAVTATMTLVALNSAIARLPGARLERLDAAFGDDGRDAAAAVEVDHHLGIDGARRDRAHLAGELIARRHLGAFEVRWQPRSTTP